jgi:hypothetical protein
MAEQRRGDKAQDRFRLLVKVERPLERGLPEGEADERVFATATGKAITMHSYLGRLLDKAIAAERAQAGQPPMPRWAFHEFRRAGLTTLADAGFLPHVADKLLNHISGTIRSVAAIHQRGEFAEERRRSLDDRAAHVLGHGEGPMPAGSVVRLVERVA